MNAVVIAFFAFVAVCSAGVITSDATAETLRSESVVNPESYQYAYETSNGITGQASGQLKEISKDESGVVSQGSFSFKTPEGQDVSITYVADENGFQPQGSVLPTPPPIPEAIARALEYLAAHPPAQEQH